MTEESVVRRLQLEKEIRDEKKEYASVAGSSKTVVKVKFVCDVGTVEFN